MKFSVNSLIAGNSETGSLVTASSSGESSEPSVPLWEGADYELMSTRSSHAPADLIVLITSNFSVAFRCIFQIL